MHCAPWIFSLLCASPSGRSVRLRPRPARAARGQPVVNGQNLQFPARAFQGGGHHLARGAPGEAPGLLTRAHPYGQVRVQVQQQQAGGLVAGQLQRAEVVPSRASRRPRNSPSRFWSLPEPGGQLRRRSATRSRTGRACTASRALARVAAWALAAAPPTPRRSSASRVPGAPRSRSSELTPPARPPRADTAKYTGLMRVDTACFSSLDSRQALANSSSRPGEVNTRSRVRRASRRPSR
jgi:hypothetical protein